MQYVKFELLLTKAAVDYISICQSHKVFFTYITMSIISIISTYSRFLIAIILILIKKKNKKKTRIILTIT